MLHIMSKLLVIMIPVLTLSLEDGWKRDTRL